MLGFLLATSYKIFFFYIALLSFILMVYTYVLIPQSVRITELTAAKMAFGQKIAVIQEFEKKNPDTNKYLDEIEKKVALSDSMLPNSADISSFLTPLEQAAAASGLQITEIKPGQSKGKAGYQEYPVEVSVKGSFTQTLTFLQKLDNFVRFNTVSNINIKSNQGILDSRLTVVFYSYSEPSGVQRDN
jgi:type IV pilus assembly protein PilO